MTRRYRVRPRTGSMVLGAVFFAFCAAVLFWMTLTNDRGLVMFRLVELGPDGARVVFGVLTAVSLGFVVAAIGVLVAYAGGTHEIVVDDEGITTPGPVWRLRATRTARFADVTEIREQSVSGQHLVTLVTPERKVSVAKSHLPDGAFEEIVTFVRERVAAR